MNHLHNQTNTELARQYLAPRLAAREHGRRLGGPDGEMVSFMLDFGIQPGREVRELRQAARAGCDPYLVPFERRAYSTWASRTHDLVLSALAECRLAPKDVRVRIAESHSADRWQLCVRPSWIASVHAKGIAVVEGMLTLSAKPYPHPLSSGAQAYYASWARAHRAGFSLVDGALYRTGPNEPWQHTHIELTALDRILEQDQPYVVPPTRKPRVTTVAKFLVRAGLSDEEFRRVRAAARVHDMSVSEWARDVLLRACGRRGAPVRQRVGQIWVSGGTLVLANQQDFEEGFLVVADTGRRRARRFEFVRPATSPRSLAARGLSAQVEDGMHPVYRVGSRLVVGKARKPRPTSR